MCLFIAFAVLDQPETFQALLDMLSAFYGINMTGDGVTDLGKKVLKMERDFTRPRASPRSTTGCRATSRPKSSRPQCRLRGQG